jgi:hypothetical protein
MGFKKVLATSSLAGMTLLAAAAVPAQASGLHWFQNQTPTVTLSGNTVTATGQVAGAGTSIVATLTVDFSYPVSCFNPGKDKGPVPGHSQSGSASTLPQTIQADHGNASFNLSETVPTPTAPASACPNSSWTAVAGPLTITGATVSITSSNGGSLSYTKTF